MANNPVVNTLTFTGSVAGQASIQAQGIAGGLTFLLPNIQPIEGQLLTAVAINGNSVFLGWSSANSNIPLAGLSQDGATTGQVITWDGTEWAPANAGGGGTPGGSSGQIQYNNSGAFAGAANSSVLGSGAVVLGIGTNGSPTATTALTVNGSSGSNHIQDWFSQNEGFVVAHLDFNGVLNSQGVVIHNTINFATAAFEVHGGNSGSPDIAQFWTPIGGTPSNVKAVWVDVHGALNLTSATTPGLVMISDNAASDPNAPIYLHNTAATQKITITPNGFFGPQIQLTGQTAPYTNTSRLVEIGAQGLYMIDAGITTNTSGCGTNGQVLMSLGLDTDNAPKGMTWTNNFQVGALTNVTGSDASISTGSRDFTIGNNFGFFTMSGKVPGPRVVLQSENAGFNIDASGNMTVSTSDTSSALTLQTPASGSLNLVTQNLELNGTSASIPFKTTATITAAQLKALSTFTLSAAANAVGANTDYTGTFGTVTIPAGMLVTITGFTTPANNGVFTVVSNTNTTLTVANAAGVAETHAGRADTSVSILPAPGNGNAYSPYFGFANYVFGTTPYTDSQTQQYAIFVTAPATIPSGLFIVSLAGGYVSDIFGGKTTSQISQLSNNFGNGPEDQFDNAPLVFTFAQSGGTNADLLSGGDGVLNLTVYYRIEPVA